MSSGSAAKRKDAEGIKQDRRAIGRRLRDPNSSRINSRGADPGPRPLDGVSLERAILWTAVQGLWAVNCGVVNQGRDGRRWALCVSLLLGFFAAKSDLSSIPNRSPAPHRGIDFRVPLDAGLDAEQGLRRLPAAGREVGLLKQLKHRPHGRPVAVAGVLGDRQADAVRREVGLHVAALGGRQHRTAAGEVLGQLGRRGGDLGRRRGACVGPRLPPLRWGC